MRQRPGADEKIKRSLRRIYLAAALLCVIFLGGSLLIFFGLQAEEDWFQAARLAVPLVFGAAVLSFSILLSALVRVVRRKEAHIRARAATDVTTGVLTKSSFLEQAAERLDDSGVGCVLVMLDLDGFKAVNDACGHLEGDRRLGLVASSLLKVFAAEDLIGRFGGDEFLVFLQGISRTRLEKKLHQLRDFLCAAQADLEWPVTCSMGAVFSEKGEKELEHLICWADQAMYQTKARGGDGFTFYTGEKSAGKQET